MSISFEKLKVEAQIQGFPIVGVVKPQYFMDLKERLDRFVNEGYHFAFNNQDIEEKCNPFKTMENCKSIIVLGLPYFVEPLQDTNKNTGGVIFRGELARTAWGEDYHRVFHRNMKNLGLSLEKLCSNIAYQSYVDTGPLVDRYLAAKANLGSYGYNNLFYHPKYGSFVFYGYMLINQEVEGLKYLKPEIVSKTLSLCKDCKLCIKSCPGEAIESPYRLNANRCISGILQSKGIMPDENKTRIGNRIYGCDECQNVCPYNAELEYSPVSSFIPTTLPENPDLIKLLNLTNKEFKEIYGNNASAWRGARVLKRNALIVLGNLEDPEAIPYIRPFLKDERDDLRDAAQWTLSKLENIEKK